MMSITANHRYSTADAGASALTAPVTTFVPPAPGTHGPRRSSSFNLFLVRETAREYGVHQEDPPVVDPPVVDTPVIDPPAGRPTPAPGPEATTAARPPTTDPAALTPLTDDELEALGERCATAYMQADALQYQAMVLLAQFHHAQGWKHTHCSSTDEWLAWRLGIHRHTAQERLRTALALEHLPLTSRAMERGRLSYAKVRALTRVATPDNEEVLLEFARAGSAANLDRFIRGWKELNRRDEVTAEQLRHQRRRFSAFVDADGMVVVRGRLDPEVGTVLMKAVDAATDALYRDEVRQRKEAYESPGAGTCSPRGAGDDRSGTEGELPRPVLHGRDLERASRALAEQALGRSAVDPTPAQRRADAVGLLAERALAAGFGGGQVSGVEGSEAAGGGLARADDLLPAGSGGSNGSSRSASPTKPAIPLSGTRAERYMVMVHVDEDTLTEHADPGLSELHDGTRISAETSRRLACDCSVVRIHRGADGKVKRAGRRMRTVSPQLRRALEARDRGCRFPGCGARFTEAHHVVHWQDGGETTLDNSLLLCRRHHRAVHEGGVTVCLDVNGQAVFFTPRGKAVAGAPPRKLPAPGRPEAGARTEAGARPGAPEGPGGADRPGRPPRGAALAGRSSPDGPAPERRKADDRDLEPPTVDAWAAAPRYNRDRYIPWEKEARAREAVDPA